MSLLGGAGGQRLAGDRSRGDVGEFKRRFKWIALSMTILFLGLVARLFQLQVVEGEDNRATARENIVRRVTLATTRGIIRDRTGKVLAASRPAYNVYVVPEWLDMVTVWPKLAEYIGLSESDKERLWKHLDELRKDDGPRKSQQILLAEDISRDAVANLSTHEAELVTRMPSGKEFRAVEVVPVPVRFYPLEEVGAHVLGYMAEVDSDKIIQLRSSGYVEGDRIGVTGVERAWESYLRGTRGWEKVVVDARGRPRTASFHGSEGKPDGILEEPHRSDPIPGRDLRLTIDAEVQKAAEKAFRGELAGGVALVDVRTGRIISLYSKPSYDPNALSGGAGKQVIADAFRRLYKDPLKPVLDKTIAGAYPPGSTFKPFTALAALEKGLIDPRAQIQCRGYYTFSKRERPRRCTHVHGATDLHKAIAESCNTYFFSLVWEREVSMDLIAEMGQRYGLGVRTGLGLNAEAAGRMPTQAWMALRNRGHFQGGFKLNAAIGQGATTVTVLQLALAYAALANGGTLYQPQIVRAVETSNGTVVQEFSPRVRRQMDIKPENLSIVQKALTAGVNEVGGTAYRARLAGVDLAGKTGTAQVSHHLTKAGDAEKVWYFNREHAWFAGYAPTKSPEVAVVVLVEHGGAGGKHAAPIAFEVVRAYQEFVKDGKDGKARAGVTKPGSTPRTGAP